ncbi:distal membrane-arm assembly complex protein 2 [Nematolebias whitei]|uniref:distal membrane-arm assembly complex protein 2 n=1 Tax=Nematolebias whitei TaxID=451745 RepID=UPI001898A880|nr:distal membrane-arm assembly complex protein 2 [Nematolebias whitei]
MALLCRPSWCLLHRCCQRSALLLVARQQRLSSSASPSPLSKFILYLTERFYDVEMLVTWKAQLKGNQIQKKNNFYGYTQSLYGSNIASAFFVLNLGGGVRFTGHSDWFRANKRGKFSWDFLKHKETSLEEIDLSYTIVNYRGLANLEKQHHLQILKLQGCSEVDDWFLAGLYIFQDTLEELDISHCPRITAGGLAALGNLRKLKRLNVSSLPRISTPGLVIILLEDMLPQCQIIADNYDHSLRQEDGGYTEEELKDRRRGTGTSSEPRGVI